MFLTRAKSILLSYLSFPFITITLYCTGKFTKQTNISRNMLCSYFSSSSSILMKTSVDLCPILPLWKSLTLNGSNLNDTVTQEKYLCPLPANRNQASTESCEIESGAANFIFIFKQNCLWLPDLDGQYYFFRSNSIFVV